jgi:hypothetical protein
MHTYDIYKHTYTHRSGLSANQIHNLTHMSLEDQEWIHELAEEDQDLESDKHHTRASSGRKRKYHDAVPKARVELREVRAQREKEKGGVRTGQIHRGVTGQIHRGGARTQVGAEDMLRKIGGEGRDLGRKSAGVLKRAVKESGKAVQRIMGTRGGKRGGKRGGGQSDEEDSEEAGGWLRNVRRRGRDLAQKSGDLARRSSDDLAQKGRNLERKTVDLAQKGGDLAQKSGKALARRGRALGRRSEEVVRKAMQTHKPRTHKSSTKTQKTQKRGAKKSARKYEDGGRLDREIHEDLIGEIGKNVKELAEEGRKYARKTGRAITRVVHPVAALAPSSAPVRGKTVAKRARVDDYDDDDFEGDEGGSESEDLDIEHGRHMLLTGSSGTRGHTPRTYKRSRVEKQESRVNGGRRRMDGGRRHVDGSRRHVDGGRREVFREVGRKGGKKRDMRADEDVEGQGGESDTFFGEIRREAKEIGRKSGKAVRGVVDTLRHWVV